MGINTHPITVGVCAAIKDCPVYYLIEWVEWHQLIGVDYFFIYDNESTIPVAETLKSFKGVQVFHTKGAAKQFDVYNDCLAKQKTKDLPICDWIAFIDDDEFIVIESGSIKEFLSDKKSSGVGLNWITFGADEDNKQLPQIERFKKHIRVDSKMNKHVKSIVQPLLVDKFINPHTPEYIEGSSYGVSEILIEGPFTTEAVHEIAWINHYYCKSRDEFIAKIDRGRCDSIEKCKISYFDEINNAAIYTSTKIIDLKKRLL